jgi:hypothetical protein
MVAFAFPAAPALPAGFVATASRSVFAAVRMGREFDSFSEAMAFACSGREFGQYVACYEVATVNGVEYRAFRGHADVGPSERTMSVSEPNVYGNPPRMAGGHWGQPGHWFNPSNGWRMEEDQERRQNKK